MFEKHGRQGIPLRDLREELEEEGLTESIAPERLDELLRRADADGDKRIRLGEFVRMIYPFNFQSCLPTSAWSAFGTCP